MRCKCGRFCNKTGPMCDACGNRGRRGLEMRKRRLNENICVAPKKKKKNAVEEHGIKQRETNLLERKAAEIKVANAANKKKRSTKDARDTSVDIEFHKTRLCQNCCRRKVQDEIKNSPYSLTLMSVDNSEIKRTKASAFCFLFKQNLTGSFLLCGECATYLTERKLTKIGKKNAWPAFIWSVLKRKDLYEKCWSFLPAMWRIWWKETVENEHNLHAIDECSSAFNEVTIETEKDLSAMRTLRWSDLMSREESLTIPVVKCPAGCSEWKHKAVNSLPLDIVFEHYLDAQLTLYSDSSLRQCTNFFRDDYLIETNILHNPQWVTKASIIMTKEGAPAVLCCRHHSQRNKLMMIHPCRHPTGTIATDKSNQYCPATLVPRTLKTAKAKQYSASLGICAMEGTYYGLDTMYLNTNGVNCGLDTTRLSCQHEALAARCRKDIKAHIDQLRSKHGISKAAHNRLTDDGLFYYPHWNAQKAEQLLGGSFMQMDDVLKLHNAIKFEGTETVVVLQNEKEKEVSVTPCWPRHIAWIHPANKKHGKRFPKIPPFKFANLNCNDLWILFGFLVTVPELWCEVCSVSPKRYDRWEGHMLALATKECFPHCCLKATKSPFTQKASLRKLATEVFNIHQDECAPRDLLANAFSDTLHPHTIVCFDSPPEEVSQEKSIVIVLRANLENKKWMPSNELHSEWELRACATDLFKPSSCLTSAAWNARLYSRHGKMLHPLWWKQDRGESSHKPMEANWNFDNGALTHWTACIYIRNKDNIPNLLKKQVLSLCGGQHRAFCATHKYPLISAPSKLKQKCVATNLSSSSSSRLCCSLSTLICPEENCITGICKEHFSKLGSADEPHYVFSGETQRHNEEPVDNRHNEIENEHTNFDESSSVGSSCSHAQSDIPFLHRNFDEKGNGKLSFVDNWENISENEFFLTDEDKNDAFVTETHEVNDFDTDDDDLSDIQMTAPTTDAGRQPIYTEVTNEPYRSTSACNHVILNNFGSCLIRRNRDMSGTKTQKSFLQSIVAKTPGSSVPLIYPEGMLFSDQFYCDEEDGSTVGAIPVCMMHDSQVLKRHGFASLEDHFRTRMSNVGLLSSANPKYHFWAFDNLVNLGLRGCDSRVILRRGFAEQQAGRGGVKIRGNKLPIFDTEQIDCRPIVNMLGATINERSSTYFATFTCSMRTHFGLKILWDWITGDTLLQFICDPRDSLSEKKAMRRSILESAGTLLSRTWMEISHIWLTYIIKSPEAPLGEIDLYFNRCELQGPDAEGNLPHWHLILWTKDNLSEKEGLAKALDRIRGNIEDMLRPKERDALISQGVFKCRDEIIRFLDMMRTFLKHKHYRRCFALMRDNVTEENEKKLICKVPDNWKLNPSPAEHSFVNINVQHSQEAIRVYQLLGLCKKSQSGNDKQSKLIFEPIHPCLIAKKHVPPADGNEGIISPVPGPLIAKNPSACNIQFTTGYTIHRYLASYVATIDNYNVMRIKPPEKETSHNTFSVTGDLQLNSKITSNRIQAKKEEKKRSLRFPKEKTARAININEPYMYMFGYAPVLTNIEGLFVSTSPFEERASTERNAPLTSLLNKNNALRDRYNQTGALTLHETIPSHFVRVKKNLPAWRQYTDGQLRKLEDDMQSALNTDNVTVFGFRPPELRFVMNQVLYRKWFKRVTNNHLLHEQITYCMRNINDNVAKTKWIDGSGATIYLRAMAAEPILSYIKKSPWTRFTTTNQRNENVRQTLLLLFTDIKESIHHNKTGALNSIPRMKHQIERRTQTLKNLFNMFVTEHEKTRLPTTWFSNIRPTQPARFLIHLLLSMGDFVEEYTLFDQPNLRSSFVYAGLLDESNPEQSAMTVTRRYITEQLTGVPSGAYKFDIYAVAAHNAIRELFVNNAYHSSDMPSVLYCRLLQTTNEKICKYLYCKKKNLVEYLLKKLSIPANGSLPKLEQAMNATIENPHCWDPTKLTKHSSQPTASFKEQQELLSLAKKQIAHYKSAVAISTKGLCIVGAGGVGKTTAALMIVLYGICQGLNCTITAIMSERAQELGCEHLNSMLCMPRSHNSTVAQVTERCISSLHRKPEKLEFIRTLDLMHFDELGNTSAENLAVKDNVFRYTRDSARPNGGLLEIGTLDHLQIDPCKGRHPLLSPLFINNFLFRRLHESVRSATDANWRRIQEITRLSPSMLANPEIKNEFITLFMQHVSSIPSDAAKHLPPNALFIYGKNKPIQIQTQKLYKKLEKNSNSINLVVSTSNDQERTVEGRMVTAAKSTTNLLDSKTKEPSKLYFYYGGRYQITANDANHKYSNSQLAVLFDMPTQAQVDEKKPIKMLLAPAGCRHMPSETDTKEKLLSNGWTSTLVHPCSENNVINVSSGIRASRVQYKLRHHVGSTLHSIMGQTLSTLVTQVSRGGQGCPYALWLPSQVVVLLSRTETAADTIFITRNKQETAEILYETLQKMSPFRNYIAHLLDQLCSPHEHNEPTVINQYQSMYLPRNAPVPTDDSGHVYVLLSMALPNGINSTYIGSTKQIHKRLSQHNSGVGSEQTSSIHLRPWALLAYVTGFDCNYTLMKSFENEYIIEKNKCLQSSDIVLTVQALITIAKDLLRDWQTKHPTLSLRLVECGSIQHVEKFNNNETFDNE